MEKSRRVAVMGVGETSMFNEAPRLVITMPSGFKASVRETNGDDEDIVSKLRDNKEGNALYKYLANIILVDDKPVSLEEIIKWKVRDIYYGIMKTRMFTHGNQVVFEHTFEGGTEKTFIEDLGFYDWDLGSEEMDEKGKLKKWPPQLGEPGYDERIIQPYRYPGDWVETETSTKKKYRFKYLTGELELKTQGMMMDDLAINDKLRLREFQLYMVTGNWQSIERFNILTSKEMAEIRTTLERVDPEFNLMCRLPHPDGGRAEELTLLGKTGFFFPRV